MQCTGCGKRLSTDELRGENCPYCESALPHQKDAIAQAAAVKELLRDSDGDGVPDVLEGTHLDPRTRTQPGDQTGTLRPPSQKKTAEHGYRPEGNGCFSGLFVAVLLAAIGSLLYYQNEIEGTAPDVEHNEYVTETGNTVVLKYKGLTIPAGDPTSKTKPRYVHDVCLLDANGDSTSDVLARAGSGNTPVIEILDGTNGQRLWASKPYDSRVDIACLDDHWFVVATGTFQMDFYHSRQLGPPVRVQASDRLRAIQMGDGCVAFKTGDGSRAGVGLPSGMAQKCTTDGRMPRLSDRVAGVMALTEKKTQVMADGIRYSLTHRKTGTPMLIVTVKRGKKTLWKRELSVRKPTFATALAVGNGMVAVVGSVLPHRDQTILVGLNALDGSPVYEVPLGKHQTDHVRFMRFNGHGIVMHHGIALQNRDIKTGQPHWRIGE